MKTEQHPKYWDFHKEIWVDELETLDEEIRDIVMTKPLDSCTLRFNSKIDKMVMERIKESND
jgi:hypothetical protein